jgi:hypothetical protein
MGNEGDEGLEDDKVQKGVLVVSAISMRGGRASIAPCVSNAYIASRLVVVVNARITATPGWNWSALEIKS